MILLHRFLTFDVFGYFPCETVYFAGTHLNDDDFYERKLKYPVTYVCAEVVPLNTPSCGLQPV